MDTGKEDSSSRGSDKEGWSKEDSKDKEDSSLRGSVKGGSKKGEEDVNKLSSTEGRQGSLQTSSGVKIPSAGSEKASSGSEASTEGGNDRSGEAVSASAACHGGLVSTGAFAAASIAFVWTTLL